MKPSLVAVFGGSGFLGRYTVRALAKAGYRVRVGVRRPNLGNYLVPMGQVGQIQVVKANIANAEHVASVVSGADAVINLVGIMRQGGRQRFQRLHRDAPEALAKAAMNAGAQTFVHVSSLGVSQNSPSLYARTKAEGEMRVREAFPAATIFRPSLMFGPEDNFFNRFAGMARMWHAVPLIGGGHTKFQPVYVGDVAAAIEKSVVDPAAARGRTYELGGPSVYAFKDMMELMLRETYRKAALVPIPFGLASFGCEPRQSHALAAAHAGPGAASEVRQRHDQRRARPPRSGHRAGFRGSDPADLYLALPPAGAVPGLDGRADGQASRRLLILRSRFSTALPAPRFPALQAHKSVLLTMMRF